jgi:hypothetical protein
MLRAILRAVALFGAVSVTIGIVPARADDVSDRMLLAFNAWAREWKLDRASIVIVRNGSVAGVAASGRTSPEEAHPIASLSKAVTGLCVARLVEQGRVKYETRLGEAMPRFFARNRPRDPRFANVTIAQLVTHSSGFTDEMSREAWGKGSAEQILLAALRQPVTNVPSSKFQYANQNFAILDRMIEEVTGESYWTVCRRLVLDPVGAGGAGPFYRLRKPPVWVDWQFSPRDFGRMMKYFDVPSKVMSFGPERWPRYENYGPGVGAWRNGDGPWTFGHSGGLTLPDYKVQYASHFSYWGEHRAGYYVNISPINDKARDALDARLFKAAQSLEHELPKVEADGKPQYSTDRPGNDLREFTMRDTPSAACKSACEDDTRCTAFTMVRPEAGRPDFICRLKGPTPRKAVRDFCCTTYVIR